MKALGMNVSYFNRQLNNLHLQNILRFGSLEFDPQGRAPLKWNVKTHVPLHCRKCGARSKPGQKRSLDNLRACKPGEQKTGCPICKTIAETKAITERFLNTHDLGIDFIITSFSTTSTCIQLVDKVSGYRFGGLLKQADLRNMARGSRPLAFYKELCRLRIEVVPFEDHIRRRFSNTTVKYLGSYKKSATQARSSFFDVSFSKKSLLRYPKGVSLQEVSMREVTKILKQNESDLCIQKTFKDELEKSGGKFIQCLGRTKDVKPGVKRCSDLIFEYKSSLGYKLRHSIYKARECNYQRFPRIGEIMAFAIVSTLLPADDWLLNQRPKLLKVKSYHDKSEDVNLEIDIVSEKLKIAIERQSAFHNSLVGYNRTQSQVDAYEYYDEQKKKLLINAGYRFVEVWTETLQLTEFIKEIKKQLPTLPTPSPREFQKIKDAWDELIKSPYEPQKQIMLKQLKKNNAKLVSHKESDILSPNDKVTVELSCGHPSTQAMKYFKEGKGLVVCSSCRPHHLNKFQSKKRRQRLEDLLGKTWESLPLDLQRQLISKPIKQPKSCPYCGEQIPMGNTEKLIVENIKKNEGIFCPACFNTGNVKIISNPIRRNIMKYSDRIKEIIRKTGYGQPERWLEYVTDKPSKTRSRYSLYINLRCPDGHSVMDTLAGWDRRLDSATRSSQLIYCSKCNPYLSGNARAPKLHEERLHKFHPRAKFIGELRQHEHIDFHCGETTKIGQFLIVHPNSKVNLNNLANLNKQGKNFGDISFCLCCSVEKGLKKPSKQKNLEAYEARLKMRAALVADELGAQSIASTSISAVGKSQQSHVKPSLQANFQCHNPNHHASNPITIGNYFNSDRPGYCPKCLEDVGVSSFAELLNKRGLPGRL